MRPAGPLDASGEAHRPGRGCSALRRPTFYVVGGPIRGTADVGGTAICSARPAGKPRRTSVGSLDGWVKRKRRTSAGEVTFCARRALLPGTAEPAGDPRKRRSATKFRHWRPPWTRRCCSAQARMGECLGCWCSETAPPAHSSVIVELDRVMFGHALLWLQRQNPNPQSPVELKLVSQLAVRGRPVYGRASAMNRYRQG